ncbi:major facilitator superfamily MFS_1 [Methylobacterium sp. 4-46]|uniref:MFS transporter n=1 Tax=unclassified Methylobacterium TaxID=2615210 RepID=UPI000152D809|nr:MULTISPECIES: MFS transporter [Methylobacterium]ACA15875.1 major facilitator superfamily MFS_1 [Methylobacterium sp. 4-46]WFT81601.1 MFS transporter [Methylobacterium nodulans]
MTASPALGPAERPAGLSPQRVRSLLIGLIAFLTLADLFAAQAILPALARAYAVAPAAMGLAVNACTFGMAAASLGVAVAGRRLDRRRGIVASLVLLTLPTALLCAAPDLTAFALLRVAQGLCMASAFTLTLAYLGEHCGPSLAASAFAAYVTGNVASNLGGRLLAAGAAEHLGLGPTFLVLAGLNLAGAGLVAVGLTHATALVPMPPVRRAALATLARHAGNPRLLAAFAVGFCILFAFIGTFTFVAFVLARAPFGLDQMALGLVCLVFLPALATTPLAGRVVPRLGPRRALRLGLAVAGAGLPPLLASHLVPLLAGLTLVAAGTFFAQAVATGFVGQAAEGDRGAASGLYLAAYFAGGLVGSIVLGAVFDRFGWPACAAGIGAALLAAGCVGARFDGRD